MISVLMPVRNHLPYLKESIDSILSQTHQDFEFLILDDASTDPVWDLLTSYNDPRIVLLKNKKNIGLTKSLNICLDRARGDFIARQDSDDISLPTRFAHQLAALENSVELVFTEGIAIGQDGKQTSDDWTDHVTKTREPEKYLLETGNCLIASSAMFRRSVFDSIGYFDPLVRFAQDYNYWLRALLTGCKIEVLRTKLIQKRVHPDMIWKDSSRLAEWVKIAQQRAYSHPIIHMPTRHGILL